MSSIKEGPAVLVTEYKDGNTKRENITITGVSSDDTEVVVDYKLGGVNSSVVLGLDGKGTDMAGNAKRLEQAGGRRKRTKRRALRRKRTVKRLRGRK